MFVLYVRAGTSADPITQSILVTNLTMGCFFMASSRFVHCPWCGRENVVSVIDGEHRCDFCKQPYFIQKKTSLVTSNREVEDIDKRRDS